MILLYHTKFGPGASQV